MTWCSSIIARIKESSDARISAIPGIPALAPIIGMPAKALVSVLAFMPAIADASDTSDLPCLVCMPDIPLVLCIPRALRGVPIGRLGRVFTIPVSIT